MDNIIFFISVFLAGILSFFSPCILPLLPVYAGVLLDDKDGARVSSGKFSISVVSLLRTLAFIAGISFVFILLGSVLALAASGGSGAWQGAGLMLIYTLGLALPFLVLALAFSYVLKHFRKLHPYLGTLKKVGGLLIIVMGILVLLGNASILTTLFE